MTSGVANPQHETADFSALRAASLFGAVTIWMHEFLVEGLKYGRVPVAKQMVGQLAGDQRIFLDLKAPWRDGAKPAGASEGPGVAYNRTRKYVRGQFGRQGSQ